MGTNDFNDMCAACGYACLSDHFLGECPYVHGDASRHAEHGAGRVVTIGGERR